MTRNPDSPTPRQPGTAPDAPTEDQVAAYLTAHPDFLSRRPEVLDFLTLPVRVAGDNVVDLQRAMVDRLKGKMALLRENAQGMIETSRSNQSVQARAHAAALAMVEPPTLPGLIRAITDDLPILLDVDVATIGFEIDNAGAARLFGAGAHRLAPGAVERVLRGEPAVLFDQATDDGSYFGAGAGLVRSAAFARVLLRDSAHPGLLALAARTPNTFKPGQGTEVLRFLADIAAALLSKWLPDPA